MTYDMLALQAGFKLKRKATVDGGPVVRHYVTRDAHLILCGKYWQLDLFGSEGCINWSDNNEPALKRALEEALFI